MKVISTVMTTIGLIRVAVAIGTGVEIGVVFGHLILRVPFLGVGLNLIVSKVLMLTGLVIVFKF